MEAGGVGVDEITETFASRVISSDDAVRLLTAAYHLSVEQATALLPINTSVKNGSADLEAITASKLVE